MGAAPSAAALYLIHLFSNFDTMCLVADALFENYRISEKHTKVPKYLLFPDLF